MTSYTSKGLPYPDETDPVGDGDAAIQALAEAVDEQLSGGGLLIQRGSVSGNPDGGVIRRIAMFAQPYATPPTVLLTSGTSVPQRVSVGVIDVYTTSVHIALYRNNSVNTTCYWVAIGEPAT